VNIFLNGSVIHFHGYHLLKPVFLFPKIPGGFLATDRVSGDRSHAEIRVSAIRKQRQIATAGLSGSNNFEHS
jgi:hypothetical protein